MSELVTELHIVDEDKNIFDTNMEYIIPLYQRAELPPIKHHKNI